MARKSKLNIGVIGLGIIGSRIAANLRTAGFQVYVWNRTPKPEPNFLGSPADVVTACDVVQIVVADSRALFDVIDSMSGSLSSRHTVICSGTVGPDATLEAARLVEASGARFLDAPFTGSKGAAEKGELVYYIGGDDETLQNVERFLKASGKEIVKIGKIGDAATVKVVTNMLGAVIVQTLAEACAVVERSGVDPKVMERALENHGVRSALIDLKLPKILAHDYDPNFSVKHMFKDAQLAIQLANNFDIDIPATTATAGVLYSAINNGWADLDYVAIAKFYETREESGEEDDDLPPQFQAGEVAVDEENESTVTSLAQEDTAVSAEESKNDNDPVQTPATESSPTPASNPEPDDDKIPQGVPPASSSAIVTEVAPAPVKGEGKKPWGWFSMRAKSK